MIDKHFEGSCQTYLGIDKLGAKNIRQEEQDFVLWIVDRRSGDVAVDASNLLPFSCAL